MVPGPKNRSATDELSALPLRDLNRSDEQTVEHQQAKEVRRPDAPGHVAPAVELRDVDDGIASSLRKVRWGQRPPELGVDLEQPDSADPRPVTRVY